MRGRHLVSDLAADTPDEIVAVLTSASRAWVEHVAPTGQASPPAFYDQPPTEWVAVPAGSAGSHFADAR